MGQQAIAGISSDHETLIMVEYPSIAAFPLGLALGRLYQSSTTRFLGSGPRISSFLALPTAPIGVLLYAWQKLAGHRYVLTNRTLSIQTAITRRTKQSVQLNTISQVRPHSEAGHDFFKSADLRIMNHNDQQAMVLAGVKESDAFRNAIQQAVAARAQVAIATARIESRTSAATT